MASLNYKLLTAAAKDPVSLVELKAHLRIDGNDEDANLLLYIRAATRAAQNVTGRQFVTATFEQWFPCFLSEIELIRSPLVAVTSIEYLDINGATQTLSTSVYNAFPNVLPGRIKLAYQQSWPAIRSHDEAVKVTYTAGYGTDQELVPEDVRNWIMLAAGDGYRHRTLANDKTMQPIPHLDGLLDSVRVPRVA